MHEGPLGIRAAVALTGELRPDDFLGRTRPSDEPGDPTHGD
jgi:hypothetical protein